MGLRHLRCWTNDHFIIKNTDFFEEEHDFPGCGFFEIFENLDFWIFDHCILYSFLPGFSLWQRGIGSTKRMMVYDQITFFMKFPIVFFYFFDVQKTMELHGAIHGAPWNSMKFHVVPLEIS